ncbi:MAG: aldehyde dehydrogenase [Halobacteriaceae archaeon]
MSSQPDIASERYRLVIGGERLDPTNGEYFTTHNPATGEAIAEVPEANTEDVDRAVQAAREAFPEWRDTPPEERGRIAYQISELISDHKDKLATIETANQGKPLSQARSDFESAARYFEYYAGAADKLEGRSVPVGPDQMDFTIREPYGVSGQVTPWNFPGNLFARGVAPAIIAGNTVVLKPAPQTPLTTLRLADLCEQAGLPDGVVNIVTGGATPGKALTSHEDVDTITFTGSVPTGQAIMKNAAEHITPVTLELGGKNPAIVCPDADLDDAVDWVDTGIYTNAGQVCSAADRAIVHESVHDEFVDRIVARAESLSIGPGEEDPDMGPLVSQDQFDKVTNYIDIGKQEGATLETGGNALDRDGWFVEPTVFTDVDPDMRIANEEIFGPVLTVLSYSTIEEAIEIANNVEYGLVGGVFTNDISRAMNIARRLEAGNVYVNKWFGDTHQTPFGGYKKSGFGREKGLDALDSYLQTKNVAIDIGGEGGDLPGA